MPVIADDVARIPDIVENYDGLRFGFRSAYDLPVIAFAKQYDDAAILYFVEVRKKRRDLAALSMRRYPATSDAVNILNNLPLYAQNDGGHRDIISNETGQDNILGTFAPDSLTISLLEKANLSTFLHESGHLFLEMQERLSSQIQEQGVQGKELSQGELSIVDDLNITLDWMGIKNIEEWGSMTLEQRRPYHEQFARGFEAYLFEGKAPNAQMQGVFQRLREWLMQVYRSLQDLNVTLTDEVRGVFDRLLAIESEASYAGQTKDSALLFRSAEEAGMIQEVFDAYRVQYEEEKRKEAERIWLIMTNNERLKGKRFYKSLRQAVEEAKYSDSNMDILLTERNALARRAGQMEVVADDIKAYAQARIGRIPLKELDPQLYGSAYRREVGRAREVLGAGNTEQAFVHQNNAVLQAFLAKAAYEKKTAVEKEQRLYEGG